MTDTELNEAVARKLGTRVCKHHPKCGGAEDPPYSTDIKAAWEVVEKLISSGDCELQIIYAPDLKKWICRDCVNHPEWEIQSKTAPRAICEAFLELDKQEKEK